MDGTIVYVYQKDELYHYGVMFFDYKTDEKTIKIVVNFENMAFYREHCLIVSSQTDESNGKLQYFCQLCNNIGTSLDYNTTTIGGSKDEICAICIGDTFFLMAMLSGGIYRVSLADGVIIASYSSSANIDSMKLNCNSTQLAVVVTVQRLPFEIALFKFQGPEAKEMVRTHLYDKREIWGFEWDTYDEHTLVFRERNRLFIHDGTSIFEQATVNGAIASFENLVVHIANVEKLLLTPENPPKTAISGVPIKAKLDVTNLLNSGKVDDAIDYAERNPHDELWNIIAKHTIFRHEYDCAEHAYVRLGDYPGVQLIKHLRNIPSNDLQNAELYFHEDKLDVAKKLFLECDRKDLLIEMYQKICDYNSVFEIIKNEDDKDAQSDAYRHLADYHYEQLDWEDAAKDYEACGNVEMYVDCLIRGNSFGDLEVLSRSLPNDSELLETIGDAFTTRGMCDQAVECYLRRQLPEKALQCCMELNQWQKAHFIAESNNMENVEGLLGKYAVETKGESDEKSLSALSLYMRAGRHLDAAKLVFDIAKDRQNKFLQYEELKQCYVLGAVLVEQHRQTLKELRKIDKNNVLEEALGVEAGLTAEQSRIFENTWRGAEAFHYIMLAQQHFFEDRIEDALQTAVVLSDYEEYLDPAEIYSMIALAAANVNQFGICSKAMMRLEALEDYEESEREEMRDLSFRLFSENPPVNPKAAKVDCPSCSTKIDPYDLQCYQCYTKFPVCIASGRLIIDNVFWLCPRCKHRAHQHEIHKWRYCPLCHDVESFK
uniref:Uncharacterized protein n=1 Tax=Caenorhabditis japonica TaxID=281687 RepID=A0A8R1E757_CAEJA